ncbi:MAG: RluA family pseudouridine synthase [Acidimicrobiales bacterium]
MSVTGPSGDETVGGPPPLGEAAPSTQRSFLVPSALEGERADRALALLSGRSRAELAAAVASGAVLLDGKVLASRGRRVRAGQLLEADLVEPPGPPPADPSFQPVVVYEDQDVIVVDKPAGVAVHPGAGRRLGTLSQALLAGYPELSQVGDPSRPGIVHRLDVGTSGLLVVARTERARVSLVDQLRTRTMGRRYAVVVLGKVEADEGVVDAPIGRSRREPTRMTVSAEGRPARTRYRVGSRHLGPPPATYLSCTLESGRTHQVRVHLSAIGHPVAGDPRYGGGAAFGLRRPFLHADRLELLHPSTGQRLAWASELPAELAAVLAALGAPLS